MKVLGMARWLAPVLLAAGVQAEENLPAVNELNFSVMVAAGVDDADSRYLAGGKATFPIGHSFGAQIEGGIANDDYYGGEWANGKYHGRGYFTEAATSKSSIGRFENGVFKEAQ